MCADELTGTCQKLQEELSRSSAEVDRVSQSLLAAEDETRALNGEVQALQDRVDATYHKVILKDLVSVCRQQFNP